MVGLTWRIQVRSLIMHGIIIHPLGDRSGFEIEQDTVNIAIDPGAVNYALSITERPLDGEARTLEYHKFDLNFDPLAHNDKVYTRGHNLDHHLRTALAPYMDRIKYVVLEQQMRCNDVSLPLMYQTIMWFTTNLRHSTTARALLEFPSRIKTSYFKASGQGYRQRKGWAVEKAMYLMEERGDFIGMQMLEAQPKPDDHADCTVMDYVAEKLIVQMAQDNKVPTKKPRGRFKRS